MIPGTGDNTREAAHVGEATARVQHGVARDDWAWDREAADGDGVAVPECEDVAGDHGGEIHQWTRRDIRASPQQT